MEGDDAVGCGKSFVGCSSIHPAARASVGDAFQPRMGISGFISIERCVVPRGPSYAGISHLIILFTSGKANIGFTCSRTAGTHIATITKLRTKNRQRKHGNSSTSKVVQSATVVVMS